MVDRYPVTDANQATGQPGRGKGQDLATAVDGSHGNSAVLLAKLEEAICARADAEQHLRQSRNHLEKVVREQTEKYQNLFNTMLDGFALCEILCQDGTPEDYRFLSVNPALTAMLGIGAEQLVGKTARQVFPQLERQVLETYGKVAVNGTPCSFEIYNAVRDSYWHVSASSPAPGQFACFFRDITVRKKMEAEKAALEIQLRQRHKMEAIGTLAGGIAHDFNNILAAILGYSEMARDDLPAASPTRRQLDEVIKAGKRARDLVRQILAFSRKEQQHREPVDLHDLIAEVVVLMRASIPASIDILLDLDPGCGMILGNQSQIHQVLMNLCANAAQAMAKKGGVLSISLREMTAPELHRFQPKFPGTGRHLRLDVGDTGPGIPPDLLERIFDPYFTTKDFGQGSGLGLAVVQGIVKSHEARIQAGNGPEGGALFSLFFPRIDPPDKEAAPSIQLATAGHERLLVVDDDQSLLPMLTVFLERQGYEVTGVGDGRKAMELLLADPQAYDLLLTDRLMPALGGESLAAEAKRLRPDLPIILCSGYLETDEEKSKKSGISASLAKPIDLKELRATLRRLLDAD